MSKWISYIVTLIIFTGCYPTKNSLISKQIIWRDTTYAYEHYHVGNYCIDNGVKMVIEIDTMEIDVFY